MTKSTAKTAAPKKPAAKKAPAKATVAASLATLLGKTPQRVARVELTTPCGLRAADMGLQARKRFKTTQLQFRATLLATFKTGEQITFAGTWTPTQDEAIRSLVADLEQSNLPRVGGAVEEQTRAGLVREMPHYAVVQPFAYPLAA